MASGLWWTTVVFLVFSFSPILANDGYSEHDLMIAIPMFIGSSFVVLCLTFLVWKCCCAPKNTTTVVTTAATNARAESSSAQPTIVYPVMMPIPYMAPAAPAFQQGWYQSLPYKPRNFYPPVTEELVNPRCSCNQGSLQSGQNPQQLENSDRQPQRRRSHPEISNRQPERLIDQPEKRTNSQPETSDSEPENPKSQPDSSNGQQSVIRHSM